MPTFSKYPEYIVYLEYNIFGLSQFVIVKSPTFAEHQEIIWTWQELPCQHKFVSVLAEFQFQNCSSQILRGYEVLHLFFCVSDKLMLFDFRRYVMPPEPSEEWWAEEQEAMVNGGES